MSETPSSEPATGPIDPVASVPAQSAPEPPVTQPVVRQHSRLNQIAASVGIAAGVVFIVAVIFGTGFVLGAHSGNGDRGGHHRGGPDGAMVHRQGPPQFPGPMMRPGFGFPGGPGGPGFERPTQPEPQTPPTSAAPTTPPR